MGIFRYMKKRRHYHETMKALSGLSTRELNDIGINRGDIRRLSLEAYARA